MAKNDSISSSEPKGNYEHRNSVYNDPARRRASVASMTKNTTGEIKNPLISIPRAELMADVENYAQQHGLMDAVELLKKGALVSQNPDNLDAVPELNAEEVRVLTEEKTHRWRHPKTHYALVALSSIGPAVQGWDQARSNGAHLSFPQEFNIAVTGSACTAAGNCERNSWIIGGINAAPHIAIALFACWLSDPVNHYIGRCGAIFLDAIFSLLGPIDVGCLRNHARLFCKFVVFNAGAIIWRLQLGFAFIPAVPLLIGIYLVPESARWLIKKGRHAQAYRSLLRIRNTPLQAARDLYFIHAQLRAESMMIEEQGLPESNFFIRAAELFTVPRVRRATQASSIIMIAQQMCGINIVAFYSSTIFVQAGSSQIVALMVSWGFGMTMFIFAIPALYTIDCWGRRTLLLATFPNMFWTLLTTGMSFYVPTDSPAHLGLIARSYFYLEVGMSWAVATNNFWAAVLSLTFPRMLQAFGPQGSFGFYAGLNVIALFLIFCFLPETSKFSLEELDYVFAVPTRQHAKYQLGTVLPWWCKRWLFFQRSAVCPELYRISRNDSVVETKYTAGKV